MTEVKSVGYAESSNRFRVLLIDDSATIRLTASNLLKNDAIELVTAEDGLDALAHIKQVAPKLIFLDLTMPIIDGFSVCSLLKSHPDYCDIPVVILSGRDGLMDRAQAIRYGAADFMLKPFSREGLLATIEHFK